MAARWCSIFGGCEVAQQLADAGVAAAPGSLGVEPASVDFHLPGLAAHRLDPQRADLPSRTPGDCAADVLAADQRDMVAELLDKGINQQAPVIAFLRCHVVEHPGAVRVFFPQALGEVGVDAAILFLAADRECQDFFLVQFSEASHGPNVANGGVTIKPVS